MQNQDKVVSAARAIERYARKNIPESSKAFGEFMYHAELLKKGHIAVHRQDAQKLPAKYQDVIRQIWNSKTGS
jgi:hypothetical protein